MEGVARWCDTTRAPHTRRTPLPQKTPAPYPRAEGVARWCDTTPTPLVHIRAPHAHPTLGNQHTPQRRQPRTWTCDALGDGLGTSGTAGPQGTSCTQTEIKDSERIKTASFPWHPPTHVAFPLPPTSTVECPPLLTPSHTQPTTQRAPTHPLPSTNNNPRSTSIKTHVQSRSHPD